MRWRPKRTDLTERLRPFITGRPAADPMVDADPVRMFLFRWIIETGDPVETVARGFDLDAQLIEDILERRVARLTESKALAIAERLGVSLDRASSTR
jgi:hypothetical protein